MKNHLWLASLVLTGTCLLRAADDIRLQPDFIIEGSHSIQTVVADDLTSIILATNAELSTVTLSRDYVVEEVLVVGGGGAGGDCCGGGGGGGGVVYSKVNGLAVAGTVFTLAAGAGGVPGAVAGNGGDSRFTLGDEEIVAIGGGGGGTIHYVNGEADAAALLGRGGGSGGGGTGEGGGAALQPGSSSGGYGKNGGGGFARRFGGGGGGASNNGDTPSVAGEGGSGGRGFDCAITGEVVAYGAGGGGGVAGDNIIGFGYDGAGNGGSEPSRNGGNGANGRGAGGGGAGGRQVASVEVEGGTGGAGGTGVVAVRLRRWVPEGAPYGSITSIRRDIFGAMVLDYSVASLGERGSAKVLLVVSRGSGSPVTNQVAVLTTPGAYTLDPQAYMEFAMGEEYSLRLVLVGAGGVAFDTAAYVCRFQERSDIYFLTGEDAAGGSSLFGTGVGWTNSAGAFLSAPADGDYVLPAGTLLRTGGAAYVFPGNCLWSLGGSLEVGQAAGMTLKIDKVETVAGESTLAVTDASRIVTIEGSDWTLRESSSLSLCLSGDGGGVSLLPALSGAGEFSVAAFGPSANMVQLDILGDNVRSTGDWRFVAAADSAGLDCFFGSSRAWPSSAVSTSGAVDFGFGGEEGTLVIDRGSITSYADLTLRSEVAEALVLDIPLACNGILVEEAGTIVLAGDNSACSGTIVFSQPDAVLVLRHVNAVGAAALDLRGATLSLDVTDFVGGLRLAKTPLSPFMLDLQGEASFDEDGRIVLFRLPMSESFDLSLIQGEPSISIPGFKGEYALGTTVQGDERIVYFFAGSDGNPVMEDSYRLKSVVTVVGYEGDDFESAPVLVRISPARIAGFDYSLVDKDHLAFTAADGSLCGYQIEKWDENGESLVWVRVPLLENGGRTTIDFWFDHDGPDCSSSPVTFGSDEFVDKRRMQDESDYTANGEAVPTRAPFAPTLAIASRFADGMGSLDVTLAVSGATERCMIMAALAKTLPANPGEPESWDEQLQVSAALSNGQESVSWHLGGGWGTDFKALRFFLLKNYRSVVYKELVGDGYAYVDLGRKGTGDDSYELQFRYPTATPPKSAMRIFGAREQNSQDSMDTTFFQDQNPKFVLDYWKGNDWRLAGMVPEAGMTYRAVLSPSLRELDWLNGEAWATVAKNDKVVAEHGVFLSNLYLFNIGGSSGSFADATYCNFSGSLFSYSRRSVATGETREQLVPAKLLSSQRAGLVDLKSGRFFENAAETGGFKLNQMTEQVVVGPLAGAAPVASSANFLYRKPGFAIIGR